MSNNHSLFTQAVANPALGATLDTREAFESRLNQMSGLEYRVAYGPKDFGAEAYPGSGRWVIRKQNRRKHQGTPDEITVMSTYYVIGENVYMAPSVGDVIWSKMVSLQVSQVPSMMCDSYDLIDLSHAELKQSLQHRFVSSQIHSSRRKCPFRPQVEVEQAPIAKRFRGSKRNWQSCSRAQS